MRILCTFPGRHGDILWALLTVRAIAESTGDPVDLLIGKEYAQLVPLLSAQPYLARVVADPDWIGDRADLREGWQPPNRTDVISPYAVTYHLGYRRWPELPLPIEIDQTVWVDIELPPLDLTRPWITAPATDTRWFDAGYRKPRRIAVGFTDEHFELKYGLTRLVDQHGLDWLLQFCTGDGRWLNEAGEGGHGWIEAAQLMAQAEIFLGCCSALHVLAVALGTPVVAMEPNKDRWNDIFWPCGKVGPQVTLVTGTDGLPTFDARHVCQAIEKVLAHGQA